MFDYFLSAFIIQTVWGGAPSRQHDNDLISKSKREKERERERERGEALQALSVEEGPFSLMNSWPQQQALRSTPERCCDADIEDFNTTLELIAKKWGPAGLRGATPPAGSTSSNDSKPQITQQQQSQDEGSARRSTDIKGSASSPVVDQQVKTISPPSRPKAVPTTLLEEKTIEMLHSAKLKEDKAHIKELNCRISENHKDELGLVASSKDSCQPKKRKQTPPSRHTLSSTRGQARPPSEVHALLDRRTYPSHPRTKPQHISPHQRPQPQQQSPPPRPQPLPSQNSASPLVVPTATDALSPSTKQTNGELWVVTSSNKLLLI